MNWKRPLWVIFKILGLLANTLTAVDMYSLQNREYLRQPIEMQLFKKQKNFFRFFFFLRYSNLDQILKILKRMMIIIGYVFSKKQTTNDVIRQMSKKSCFGRPFNEEPDKRFQTLLKSLRQHLCHTYWSLWQKLSWKNPPIVIFKILGLLVDTLIADDMYCLLNREYLTQPNQM